MNNTADNSYPQALAFKGSNILDFLQSSNFKGDGLFPRGPENTAYASVFTGTSYLLPVNNKDLHISNVTFEPGCRNHWHIHHGAAQILIVVGGSGWYQEEGKPALALNPGDVIYIQPEIKHWHGASKDSWFSHLAISVPVAEQTSNEFLTPVSEEEYSQLA
ncbi:cupin domain-containing protein [Psittacicella gerlachiana]|uniref:Cupin n=1 Tax=Psittacicella gerlachiana TaxID=2028574 RepID=A0A3A1Y2C7_9GAMM|nr:cupin domain-containing protein [Psittacicella gerlachiana]RIY31456.1 cupin [Psittacicella gerlachiana]